MASVDLSFSDSYTPPSYNAVNLSFGNSYNYTLTGNVTTTVTPQSVLAKAVSHTGNITTSVTPQAVMKTQPHITGNVTTTVTPQATLQAAINHALTGDVTVTTDVAAATDYIVNPSGHILLLSQTFEPLPGDDVQLLVATGNVVMAREIKVTAEGTVVLTGGVVTTGDDLPTLDGTGTLTGAAVVTGDELPTLDGAATKTGSTVQTGDDLPTVAMTMTALNFFRVDTTFTAPQLIAQLGELQTILTLDRPFAAPTLNASWFQPIGVDTLFAQPRLRASLSAANENAVDTDFDAPKLEATLHRSTQPGVDALITAPEPDIEIMAGGLLSLDTTLAEPRLSAQLLTRYGLEVDTTFAEPAVAATIGAMFSVDLTADAPTLTAALTPGLTVETLFTAPLSDSSIVASGISLEAAFTAPEMQATLAGAGLSLNQPFALPIPDLQISSGRNILSVDAVMTVPTSEAVMLPRHALMLDTLLPTLRCDIKLRAVPTIQLDTEFATWQLTAFTQGNLQVEQAMPPPHLHALLSRCSFTQEFV